MRLGFIFGFLLGAGVASILSRRERTEEPLAPMDAAATAAIEDVEDSGQGVVDQLRHRLDEAKAAAREEAQEKEAELTRRFEETINREKSES